MTNWLDSKIFTLLEGGLDGLSLRNKVMADNIANVDTPNFKRADVNFEKVLQAALKDKDADIQLQRTSSVHFPGTTINGNFVVKDNSTSFRNDGNNVDIDLEMTKLAQNSLHYNALSAAYTSHINMLRQVIQS
ncbi:MAG: flagellar biosynthesis protein FlgB [Gracilibacter sp. BRH_c7a]|nr:MAG: flagellar biosynthesis protein FlgB [Gracilibacter sp. BRH_c7a]